MGHQTSQTHSDPAPAVEPAQTGSGLSRRAGEAVVFLASAAVLVLEIVSIRLVAPYVGISLETSSAVIGTALAAIATGAWAGGRSADRWDPGALLAPALGLGGALTVLTLPVVRGVGESLRGGPDAPGVLLLAMLAVFPPAALLSAVTPLVVKLHLGELSRTGTVVGRLSAIATVGAIVATFGTGFVLLTAFTTGAIVIGTGSLLLLVAAVVAAGRLLGQGGRRGPWLRGTLPVVLLLVAMPVLATLAPTPCQVETTYHCVRVQEDPERPGGRLLWLDALPHSYVDLDDPRHLEFSYATAVAVVADHLHPVDRPLASLSIGGGGLTLPRYLAATHPGSSATVLEIDPGVARVALQRLGAASIPGLRLRVGDARVRLAEDADTRYDLVIGDAFGGLAVPWHLTTEETVTRIRQALAPDGIYAVNVIDYRPQRFVKAELATLRTVFPHVILLAGTEALAGVGGGNHVLIASQKALPVAELRQELHAAVPDWDLLDPAATASFVGTARPLTDAWAPVDQMLAR